MMKANNNKGQTLIEAIAALAFATVIISAIALAIITSLDNATFSKNQNLATHYAQEGMDIMRQQSETDWATFDSKKGNTYCLSQSSTKLDAESTCLNTPNITNLIGFIRKVNIDAGAGCGGVGNKVTISVYWSDGKCRDTGNPYCHNVVLDSCLAQIHNTNP